MHQAASSTSMPSSQAEWVGTISKLSAQRVMEPYHTGPVIGCPTNSSSYMKGFACTCPTNSNHHEFARQVAGTKIWSLVDFWTQRVIHVMRPFPSDSLQGLVLGVCGLS